MLNYSKEPSVRCMPFLLFTILSLSVSVLSTNTSNEIKKSTGGRVAHMLKEVLFPSGLRRDREGPEGVYFFRWEKNSLMPSLSKIFFCSFAKVAIPLTLSFFMLCFFKSLPEAYKDAKYHRDESYKRNAAAAFFAATVLAFSLMHLGATAWKTYVREFKK